MNTKCVQKIKSLGATETEIFVLNDEVTYGRTHVRRYARTELRAYGRTCGKTEI